MPARDKQSGLLQAVRQWAALAGVVALLVALVMHNLGYGRLPARIVVLAAGLLALIASVALNWSVIWPKIRARATKAGAGSLAAVLLFLAILSGANYISYRHPARADLTQQKVYTLSPQTRKVLRNLKQDIKFLAYYDTHGQQRARYQQARDTLDQYVRASRRLTLQVIDLYSKHFEIQAAKAKGIKSFPCLVVEAGDNREVISEWELNEQKVTSAILKVTTKKPRKVYFLTGHGEGDPDSYEPDTGFSRLKQALLEENYGVEKLNLMEKREVPSDCTVLVIAGPKVDPAQQEEQALRNYFQGPGRVLLLLAPPPSPNLGQLFLDTFGTKVREDIVADPGMNLEGSLVVPGVMTYQYHAITTPMRGLVTVFPVSRSLEITRPETYQPGTQVNELVKTSALSWGETNKFNLEYTEGKDAKGPLVLAAAAQQELAEPSPPADKKKEEKPKQTRRVVVVGSWQAAANAFVLLGNKDFFANCVDWLAEAEDLIAIRPRTPEPAPLYLTARQRKTVQLVSMWLLPCILLLLGLGIWWKRR